MVRYTNEEILGAWKRFAIAFTAWALIVAVWSWLFPQRLKSDDDDLSLAFYGLGALVLGAWLVMLLAFTLGYSCQLAGRQLSRIFRLPNQPDR